MRGAALGSYAMLMTAVAFVAFALQISTKHNRAVGDAVGDADASEPARACRRCGRAGVRACICERARVCKCECGCGGLKRACA